MQPPRPFKSTRHVSLQILLAFRLTNNDTDLLIPGVRQSEGRIFVKRSMS